MPTGPDCKMSFDECLDWAEDHDIDDPEAYCAKMEEE